jgi:sulfotransferase
MIEKQFYFLAGLPRSGSTVLASILNQNDSLYTTNTSPLLDLLYLNEQAWRKCPSVIANPYPIQLENISESIINSCWQHIDQDTIIDKHRAWGRNLPTIKTIFKKEPKLIITARDIPSIIASFITLLRASSQKPTYIDSMLAQDGRFINDFNRCDLLWNEFIKDTWDSFRTAWNYDKTKLLIIEYDDLVTNPKETITKVYDFLELPKFNHDFNNIHNKTVDDDLIAWGLEGLHTIRPQLKKTSSDCNDIIGEELANQYKKMNLEFWR